MPELRIMASLSDPKAYTFSTTPYTTIYITYGAGFD